MSLSAKPSKINKDQYVSADTGSLFITSIVRPTTIILDGNISIPIQLQPQEFYSPIACQSFEASPYSVNYVTSLGQSSEAFEPPPPASAPPTPSNTPTISITPTPTPTISQSVTVTPSITHTPSVTQTPPTSQTPTPTPSVSQSVSVTTTPSITTTPSVTQTPSVTTTSSVTQTPSVTTTPSVTQTPSVTTTSSVTQTPSVTTTPSVTQTPSVTITPSSTPAPNLWSPSEISTLAWYDAADSSSITQTSNEVTQLSDKSGNNLHLAPIAGATGATTDTTTLNGLNLLNFNGDCLENSNFSYDQQNNNLLLAFLIKIDASTSGTQHFIFAGTSSTTPSRSAIRKRGTNNVVELFGERNGGNTFVQFTNFTLGDYHIAIGRYNGTNSATFLNGTLCNTGDIGDAILDSLQFGHAEGEAQFFIGDIGEIIVFNDNNDRQKIEGYLAHKWGLTANLPTNHPYKDSAPLISLDPTPSPTVTQTPTATPSVTTTPSVTQTPSVTTTPSVTQTPSVSITPSITNTPSVTASPTITPTPSLSQYIFDSLPDSDIQFSITNSSNDPQFDDVSYKNEIQKAADKWDKIITSKPKPGWDMDIGIEFKDLPAGVLGSAGITHYDGTLNFGDFFPTAGSINFSTNYLSGMRHNTGNAGETELYYVALHEIGHLLGVGSSILSQNSSIIGEPVVSYIEDSVTKYYYTGQHAFQAYKDYFEPLGYNVSQFSGIPIEDDGGAGTANSHPEEGIVGGSISANDRTIGGVFHPGLEHELMAGWSEGGNYNPLSKITIGFLEDMGYSVDYNEADPYNPEDPLFGVVSVTPTPSNTTTPTVTPTPTITPTVTPSSPGEIDIYILGGQSNAEGFADSSDLSAEDSTQDGLFYVSWDSSNAGDNYNSSTQYYSDWSSSLVAGYTAPDAPQTSIGDNGRFGPEIGLVSRLNELSNSGNKVGILKHAIGSAEISLWADGAEGYTRLLNAISDGITKLTNLGYTYKIKGVVWWQGESNGNQDITSDYTSLLSRLRSHLNSNYNVSAASASQIPFVLTRGGTWGNAIETVANADNYTALIDATEYGQINFTDTSSFQQDSDGILANNADLIVLQDGLTLMDYGSEWTAVNTGTNVTYNTGDHLTVWMLSGSNVLIKDGTVQASRDAAVTGGTDGVWHYKGIWGVHPQSNKGTTYDTAEPAIRLNVHIGSGDFTSSKRYRTSLQNDMFSIGLDYADKLAVATLGQAPLWTPSEITNEGWYDFSDLSTLTFDGSNNITNVTNKGSGPDLASFSGSTITLTENFQNHKSVATMFGGNDRFVANNFNASNSSMNHLYMVFNPSLIDNANDSLLQLISGSVGGSDLRQLIIWAQGDTSSSFFGKVYGNQINVYSDGNFKNSSNQHAAFSSSDLSDSWNIFELVFDESANTLQFFLNGTLVDTATNYNIDLSNSMQLHLMFSSSGQYIEGYWGEFIATSDTTNNEKIQGYLAHKWGLTGNLPTNHTYKNSPPLA